MNETEKMILVGAGIVSVSVLLGSYIIASKLSNSLDNKNFWAGSNIPAVADDVHQVTGGLATIGSSLANLGNALNQWTTVK